MGTRPGIAGGRLIGALLLSLVSAACNGASSSPSEDPDPGGPGSGGGGAAACRLGPAVYTIDTTGGGVTSTTRGNCAFNDNAVESTCTNVYTDSTGQAFTSVTVTRYSTRGDVVDEVAVIPPRNRALSATTTISGLVNSRGTSDHSYDSQGRIVSTVTETVVTTAGGPQTNTTTTTYSSWDSAGRPTASTIAAVGPPINSTFTYNDASRTQVSTTVGSGVSCTQQFDQNGNPTTGTCTSGTTTTFSTTSTLQVCR